MCEKEYELKQEIKELEDRKSELVSKRISYHNSMKSIKELYVQTRNIRLVDSVTRYTVAIKDIEFEIHIVNEELLTVYKKLNHIMERNSRQRKREVNFFYGTDMFDILDRLERDGSINGIKF